MNFIRREEGKLRFNGQVVRMKQKLINRLRRGQFSERTEYKGRRQGMENWTWGLRLNEVHVEKQ